MKKDELEVEDKSQEKHEKLPILTKSVQFSDGVLIQNDNNIMIMKEKDLPKFTSYLPKYEFIESKDKCFKGKSIKNCTCRLRLL